MPFFRLSELPDVVIAPGYSSAHGQTVTGRDLEVGFENRDLLDELTTAVENGEDMTDVFNRRPLWDRLTAVSLRDAAREYLNPQRYVQVTLRPEGKQ